MATMAVVTERALEVWSERLGRPLTEDDAEPASWAAAQYRSTVSGAEYADGIDRLP
jgi:hypothetical protein